MLLPIRFYNIVINVLAVALLMRNINERLSIEK